MFLANKWWASVWNCQFLFYFITVRALWCRLLLLKLLGVSNTHLIVLSDIPSSIYPGTLNFGLVLHFLSLLRRLILASARSQNCADKLSCVIKSATTSTTSAKTDAKDGCPLYNFCLGITAVLNRINFYR